MKLKAFFELTRVPSVFSAMSNVYAGYLIAGGLFPSKGMILGMAASALFIMAGMALNDVADVEEDKKTRGNRPIPSGRISMATAKAIVYGLFSGGVILILLAQPRTLIMAMLLIFSICMYNLVAKKNKSGPFFMALCRVLNLMLGVSIGMGTTGLGGFFSMEIIRCLMLLGAYIILIIYIAKDEDVGNTRLRVNSFLYSWVSWVVLGLVFLWIQGLGFKMILALITLVALNVLLLNPFLKLLKNPGTSETQVMVRTMLAFMPLVDVIIMFHAGTGPFLTLLALVFIPPAKWVGKWISST